MRWAMMPRQTVPRADTLRTPAGRAGGPTGEHNDFIFRLLLFKHGKMKRDKRSLFWQLDFQR